MPCVARGVEVLRVIAAREDAAVDLRVQRLDAAVHHLGKAGDVRDRRRRPDRHRPAPGRCRRSTPARNHACSSPAAKSTSPLLSETLNTARRIRLFLSLAKHTHGRPSKRASRPPQSCERSTPQFTCVGVSIRSHSRPFCAISARSPSNWSAHSTGCGFRPPSRRPPPAESRSTPARPRSCSTTDTEGCSFSLNFSVLSALFGLTPEGDGRYYPRAVQLFRDPRKAALRGFFFVRESAHQSGGPG